MSFQHFPQRKKFEHLNTTSKKVSNLLDRSLGATAQAFRQVCEEPLTQDQRQQNGRTVAIQAGDKLIYNQSIHYFVLLFYFGIMIERFSYDLEM